MIKKGTGTKTIHWIYQWSRPLIGAIALVGSMKTPFTAEFSGTAADICPTTGCNKVLPSAYATVFGLPLTLFGFFAYKSMAVLARALWIFPETERSLRSKLEESTAIFGLGTAMLFFSSYLMVVMLFKIQGLFPYCVASAIVFVTLFILTLSVGFGPNHANCDRLSHGNSDMSWRHWNLR